jgi:hypothetical protein
MRGFDKKKKENQVHLPIVKKRPYLIRIKGERVGVWKAKVNLV